MKMFLAIYKLNQESRRHRFIIQTPGLSYIAQDFFQGHCNITHLGRSLGGKSGGREITSTNLLLCGLG